MSVEVVTLSEHIDLENTVLRLGDRVAALEKPKGTANVIIPMDVYTRSIRRDFAEWVRTTYNTWDAYSTEEILKMYEEEHDAD